MGTSPELSCLPRYPLSIILAYLQQQQQQQQHLQTTTTVVCNSSESSLIVHPHNRNAISLLLTNQRFARTILPLYRLPKHLSRTYHYHRGGGGGGGGVIVVEERYRFTIFPIQDSQTLLDRLNTRRLRSRITWRSKKKRIKEKEEQFLHNRNKNNSYDNDALSAQKQQQRHYHCYEYGRTIEELAYEEWLIMEINHHTNAVANDKHNYDDRTTINDAKNAWRVWPAHLELLRFLNSNINDDDDDEQQQQQQQQQRIASPITTITIGNNWFKNGIALLASYPRSGNTLLRTLLERTTSIVTGSDTRPDRTLSKSLAVEYDLVGEGIVSSGIDQQQQQRGGVHIVKTHFPERKGWTPVTGHRVLLLVRNPYDAIDSYWNLCCTNTHTRTLDDAIYTKYAGKFDGLARHEIEIWCNFHYYWLDVCKKNKVPILLVRYEDLILNVETEMIRVMKFLLHDDNNDCGGGSSSSGSGTLNSFWEWRIRHAIGNTRATNAAGSAAASAALSTTSNTTLSNNECGTTATQISNLGSYRPRSSSGGIASIGKSLRKNHYSDKIMLHIHEVAVSLELERRKKHSHDVATAAATIATTPREQGVVQNNKKNTTLLQLFGYDIYTQQFPNNFKEDIPTLSCTRRYDDDNNNSPLMNKVCGIVVINSTSEIRSKDDPYGRAMTNWRRGETCGDTNPFPLV